ncbi:unnamed protein product [Arabidopsis arenosa]|uniref:Uncharacterized protein n=1 Tax=Arabidopsis arenosa TaxID=38785 RepID=A0A8S1ZFH7_ARAAE|nr:unnamed protein product [Arabidopsis arenosa]
MSQLLFRLSKLSSRNNVLIHKSVRLFSTSPYLTLGSVGEDLPGEGGGYIGDILLFDPAKEELVTVKDKTIPEELVNSKLVGASHGWTFFSDRCNHNSEDHWVESPSGQKFLSQMVLSRPFSTIQRADIDGV